MRLDIQRNYNLDQFDYNSCLNQWFIFITNSVYFVFFVFSVFSKIATIIPHIALYYTRFSYWITYVKQLLDTHIIIDYQFYTISIYGTPNIPENDYLCTIPLATFLFPSKNLQVWDDFWVIIWYLITVDDFLYSSDTYTFYLHGTLWI